MDLSKALAEMLEGSDGSRINTVANILKDGGVGTADDLKYFDWNSLKDLGGLSNMEVNKIMRYIQEKFPEEYEEHKRKRTEERKLQNEVEILNFKAEHEKKLQQQKMELEKEMEKILKKRQEVEEQLKRSQEQSGASKDKASSWTETPMQCWKDFKKYVTKSESTDFHENNAKQKKKFKGPKGPSKYENIEEVISEIFAGFSNEERINQIKHILHEDGITSADELSCFDWKSMEDLGLTSSEAARIMDFVKENFPKHFKIHEIRRDEANRMQEELSKCKEEIIKLSKSAKQSRENKTEDVEMQEKQSSFQAEATEQRQQKMDEASSNKSEDQTQTKNSIHLQEEPQKSSSHSGTVMLKRRIKPENYQTQEDCSNHQAGNPPNDSFKDSNSNNNTSNDQPQESEVN